jgi:hypothetical protein
MPEEREAKTGPVLAGPEAASKVSEGVRQRFSESIDTTGKALTAIAGLGIFFFATGYFVEWQRLKRGALPPEEILPLIPKGQVAAAGVRELVISLVFGGITLLVLGIGFVRVAKATKDRKGRLARRLNQLLSREVAFPTAVVGVVTLLIVPFSFAGLLVAAVLTGLLYYGLRLVHRYLEDGDGAKFPLGRLCLAIAIAAVVLTGARQREFPQPRPHARITLVSNNKLMEGGYIASDSDKVLVKVHGSGGNPPKLVVLNRDQFREIQMETSPPIPPLATSLFEKAIDLAIPKVYFTCIPPECRTGENTQIGPSVFF